MVMIQKLRWAVLAGAALILSGCVAPPPPNAYNTAYSQPTYSQPSYANSEPEYYNSSEPLPVYYEGNQYQPQQSYVEPYYYAPAYPVVGASIGYSIYSDHYYHDRPKKRFKKRGKHKHDDHHHVKKGHKDKKKAGKRKGKGKGKKHAGKKHRHNGEMSAAKRKTVLLLQNLDSRREGQRASNGN